MTIDIPNIDYNVIIAKIESMLALIAVDNSDFICSTCLKTKDKLIDLAGYILREKAETAGYNIYDCLNDFYNEIEKNANDTEKNDFAGL